MSTYKIVTHSGNDSAIDPFRSMIFSDFLKSLRYGNEWYALIDSERYHHAYSRLITGLLERQDTVVRLACLSDDPDTCLGWSMSERNRLHYAYVKVDFRKQGIGRALVPVDFTEVTHLTVIGRAIWQNKLPDVIFDPFFS